jgi:hypothetical protein
VHAPTAPERDAPSRVIGIGASAGGMDALTTPVSQPPADLPHASCIDEESRDRTEGPASGLAGPEDNGALWEVGNGRQLRSKLQAGAHAARAAA